MSIGAKEGKAREKPSPLCTVLANQTVLLRGPPGWGALGRAGPVDGDSPLFDPHCARPLGRGHSSLLSMSVTSLKIFAPHY